MDVVKELFRQIRDDVEISTAVTDFHSIQLFTQVFAMTQFEISWSNDTYYHYHKPDHDCSTVDGNKKIFPGVRFQKDD